MSVRLRLSLVLAVVTVSTGLGSVGHPSAAGSARYGGPNSEWVNRLLTRAPNWSCPSSPSASDARPPQINSDSCVRDAYVAAAVLQAWAAECYARFEQDERAAQAAASMVGELNRADELCSDGPSLGNRTCDTHRIYRCGERK